MEKDIQYLHEIIKTMFPDAIKVEVNVNCEGITVVPEFRTNLDGFSQKSITGKWLKEKV